MLASLLPGLRDVRTPLTVGYLWLFTAWLVFGEHVPTSRPPGNGLVAQLFELGGLLGRAAPIAALSFVAYLLGALLTIPVENRLVSALLSTIGRFTIDARLTSWEYAQGRMRLAAQLNKLQSRPIDLSEPDRIAIDHFESRSRSRLPINDLRARLLVANQQMYGEYDRLAAEASFRVNMAPPLLALGLLVAFDLNVLVGLSMIVGAVLLLVQGAIRLDLSNTVLRRAVLAGVIEEADTKAIRELLDRTSSQQ